MKKKIRIGTRGSLLAICQAKLVRKKILKKGFDSEIIIIESSGDLNLIEPIYSMNITGVFTKELDTALLNHQIDIAVHSLKDVPTQLPNELIISAMLKRDFPQDVLVRNVNSKNKGFNNLNLLTSSLRRKAFWKNYYNNTKFHTVRGNLHTRLNKMNKNEADGMFLSLAGIKRLKINIPYEILNFMIPAPAQGVIGIISNKKNWKVNNLLKTINHEPTMKCVTLERYFLQILNTGCSAPIGALASIKNGCIKFSAQLSSLNGDKFIKFDSFISNLNDIQKIVKYLLNQGGYSIIQEIKKFRKIKL